MSSHDSVNHPEHYTSHPSGVEHIQITEHMNFCVGNAVKYLWRAGQKGDHLEDLKKARWYVDREIARIEKTSVEDEGDKGDEGDEAVAAWHRRLVEEHFPGPGPRPAAWEDLSPALRGVYRELFEMGGEAS